MMIKLMKSNGLEDVVKELFAIIEIILIDSHFL